MAKGIILGGRFGEILARQKGGEEIELGELLVAESKDSRTLFQVYDLLFGSQLSPQHLEMIAGLNLEEQVDITFMDPQQRQYTLALLKGLVTLQQGSMSSPKGLPVVFSDLREVRANDLQLAKPKSPLYLGDLRSGSKVLDLPLLVDAPEVIAHHMLIAATTGRGKSNLMKVMLWDLVGKESVGILVLDPHDEYYRSDPGLKDHPQKDAVRYYASRPFPGEASLKINIELLRPAHFHGVIDWSQAQSDCVVAYHRHYADRWIQSIVEEKSIPVQLREETIGVVRRKLMQILHLNVKNGVLHASGPFSLDAGRSTIHDMVSDLERSRVVIVDTSSCEGPLEILIGGMIAQELLDRYQQYKASGILAEKPVVGIVLEEAPRVLGAEVLERGPNIFSTIAREGRKFRVGLIAITQLPSAIPRSILANMNTKIILGLEMRPERQAIMESAAQDLSRDDRLIASLDRGEAIVSSNFTRFAVPIQIPLFSSRVDASKKHTPLPSRNFSAVKM